jgi:ABC-type Fe3+ transport system substrate-binding protein
VAGSRTKRDIHYVLDPFGNRVLALSKILISAGGVVAGNKQQEAVKALIVFLTSSASQSVITQKGFTPPDTR